MVLKAYIMNKVILYIATSSDGFIADSDGSVDWLPHPQNDDDLEVVGYKKLMERVDTILMGSKSYEQIMDFGDWGWPDKHTYVFSSQALESPLSSITVTNDSPSHLIHKMQGRNSDKDIWLLGGAQLVKSCAEYRLIDEIILTIVPQNLGKGIKLDLSFGEFDLKSQQPLMEGMIQRIYLRKEL